MSMSELQSRQKSKNMKIKEKKAFRVSHRISHDNYSTEEWKLFKNSLELEVIRKLSLTE
jgi:hypothetical protein